MQETFILRGKVIRQARLLKNVSITDFSELTGISTNYLAMMEREERKTISHRNKFKILRALRRDLKVSDEVLTALTLIVEFDENKGELLNGNGQK